MTADKESSRVFGESLAQCLVATYILQSNISDAIIIKIYNAYRVYALDVIAAILYGS